jgi:alpha-tubulin suppressor-like RCC1 family protein
VTHTDRSRRLATHLALALGSLAAGGCGGDVVCIPGVPCGPVPSYAEPQPAPVVTAQRFAAIGLGHWHSCMLTAQGAAWCWGDNQYGQLGAVSDQTCVEGAELPCSSRPLPVEGGHAFASLAAAVRHTCGLTPAGAAWCWGFGLGGQLGDGSRGNSRVPVPVAGGHVFTQLSMSLFTDHQCGLKADGSLWCWGTSLGVGSTGPAASAVPVRWAEASAVAFAQIALGESHACGLDVAGQAWCVGSNDQGQLGDGGSAASAVPVPVAGGRRYVLLVAGPGHNCALDATGQAWCWGWGNAVGDGAGDQAPPRRVPVAVAGTLRFERLSAGAGRTCGLAAGGAAWCWGDGWNGVLGSGTLAAQPAPVAVAVPPSVALVALEAGGVVTCGIDTAGQAWCWGGNESGAVGRPVVGR